MRSGKMSEKRFTNVSMGREEAYCDFSIIKVGDKIISEIPTNDAIRICDLLNEQQATIKYLTIEKHQENKRFQTIIAELKKENEQLKEELNNLKKDETMLYHYWTLARYSGDGV